MAQNYRRNEILSNPFYLALVAVSTIFVVTALAYLVSGFTLDSTMAPGSDSSLDGAPPSERSIAVAKWFDRNGPLALGVEFLVMLAVGAVMMATDRWYSQRGKRDKG